MKPIIIVQGAQWGSEAKGAISGYLCRSRNVEYAVRTGATNAGHTVIYKNQIVKLQQLPVGFVNPETVLVIGAGAIIDPVILEREVELLSRLTGTNIRERLKIDGRAGIHLPEHAILSSTSGRHHAIGATGKGCSEALMDRIKNRGIDGDLFAALPESEDYEMCDTEALLNFAYDEGAQILLEGTQGTLLDLYLGPYPYVTHKQTGPAQWMLEAGLSPALETEIVMVARTYPIRVAGNSGPMPNETSWPILAREINARLAAKDLQPVVRDESITRFCEAMAEVSGQFALPSHSEYGLDQHRWAEHERFHYKETISEQHTAAWSQLDAITQMDLGQLFEMTTVTKKLRRIAHMHWPAFARATRQVRPDWVAVTFMNYLAPEKWFRVGEKCSDEENLFIENVSKVARAPVRLVTYGPADEHVLERVDVRPMVGV